MSKNIGTLQDKNNNIIYPIGFETVTNSNGTALKLPDGTMICYGTKSFLGQACNVDYWSNFNRTPENLSCNFPIAFVGNLPIITYGHYSSSGGRVAFYTTKQCTLTRTHEFGMLYSKNANPKTTDFYVNYIAIGRWK